MSVINFKISETLDKQLNKIIRQKGFQSKAELFRFAVFNYINSLKKFSDEDEEFAYLESKLARLLTKKFSGRKLPSLRKQLQKV